MKYDGGWMKGGGMWMDKYHLIDIHPHTTTFHPPTIIFHSSTHSLSSPKFLLIHHHLSPIDLAAGSMETSRARRQKTS